MNCGIHADSTSVRLPVIAFAMSIETSFQIRKGPHTATQYSTMKAQFRYIYNLLLCSHPPSTVHVTEVVYSDQCTFGVKIFRSHEFIYYVHHQTSKQH